MSRGTPPKVSQTSVKYGESELLYSLPPARPLQYPPLNNQMGGSSPMHHFDKPCQVQQVLKPVRVIHSLRVEAQPHSEHNGSGRPRYSSPLQMRDREVVSKRHRCLLGLY
ncbi:hypothetical protein JTE90_021845 [Oedothorax gibbosus]|uniref:Uncharacterized protein n=1 Tax=Oedothorax gibbosus TaxID=931172 RepID=A0AAV6UY81_9ARAC|nr:hypothetical protein JTE90_021845 [Oedothorax gibbosus]